MATKKTAAANEIHIKEEPREEEYFRRTQATEILPPELNVTVKDGFRFGIGFILASLIFYIIVAVGVIVLIKAAPLLNLH
jgi:hypothetical protein